MASPERQNTCGECKHFSTSYMNGTPYETIIEDGNEIQEGVCRVNCGLILQRRNETKPCMQPEGFFEPLENNLEETYQQAEESTQI